MYASPPLDCDGGLFFTQYVCIRIIITRRHAFACLMTFFLNKFLSCECVIVHSNSKIKDRDYSRIFTLKPLVLSLPSQTCGDRIENGQREKSIKEIINEKVQTLNIISELYF